MSALSDRIRATPNYTSRVIDVDGWDIKVEVRSLSVAGFDEVMKSTPDATNPGADISVDLAIAACFDPDTGERVFSADDREWLLDKSAAPILAVSTVVQELSGLSAKAQDIAGKD